MGWGSPDSCSWTWDQDGHNAVVGLLAKLTVRNRKLRKETVQEGSSLLWPGGHSKETKRSSFDSLQVVESDVGGGWMGCLKCLQKSTPMQ